MSKLYFFRHGQASLGADNYDVLSPKGREQAKQLGIHLVNEDIRFAQAFVGPLARQKDTYKGVKECYENNQLTFPTAVEIKGLKEHQGMETMKIALPELLKTDDYLKKLTRSTQENPSLAMRNGMLGFQYFLGNWAEGHFTVDGIPTWKSFREEVRSGLDEILNATQQGENIALFTSGGTISAIMGECLGLPTEKSVAELNFSVRNTSFTTFLLTGDKFNLLSFNELPHLKKDMITFV